MQESFYTSGLSHTSNVSKKLKKAGRNEEWNFLGRELQWGECRLPGKREMGLEMEVEIRDEKGS